MFIKNNIYLLAIVSSLILSNYARAGEKIAEPTSIDMPTRLVSLNIRILPDYQIINTLENQNKKVGKFIEDLDREEYSVFFYKKPTGLFTWLKPEKHAAKLSSKIATYLAIDPNGVFELVPPGYKPEYYQFEDEKPNSQTNDTAKKPVGMAGSSRLAGSSGTQAKRSATTGFSTNGTEYQELRKPHYKHDPSKDNTHAEELQNDLRNSASVAVDYAAIRENLETAARQSMGHGFAARMGRLAPRSVFNQQELELTCDSNKHVEESSQQTLAVSSNRSNIQKNAYSMDICMGLSTPFFGVKVAHEKDASSSSMGSTQSYQYCASGKAMINIGSYTILKKAIQRDLFTEEFLQDLDELGQSPYSTDSISEFLYTYGDIIPLSVSFGAYRYFDSAVYHESISACRSDQEKISNSIKAGLSSAGSFIPVKGELGLNSSKENETRNDNSESHEATHASSNSGGGNIGCGNNFNGCLEAFAENPSTIEATKFERILRMDQLIEEFLTNPEEINYEYSQAISHLRRYFDACESLCLPVEYPGKIFKLVHTSQVPELDDLALTAHRCYNGLDRRHLDSSVRSNYLHVRKVENKHSHGQHWDIQSIKNAPDTMIIALSEYENRYFKSLQDALVCGRSYINEDKRDNKSRWAYLACDSSLEHHSDKGLWRFISLGSGFVQIMHKESGHVLAVDKHKKDIRDEISYRVHLCNPNMIDVKKMSIWKIVPVDA